MAGAAVPQRSGLRDCGPREDRWRSYGLQDHDRRLLIMVAARDTAWVFSKAALRKEFVQRSCC
jgi:hypothetical protein